MSRIEHVIPVEHGYDDIEQQWSCTEDGYTPTIGVGYGSLGGELYWYATTDVFAHRISEMRSAGSGRRSTRRSAAPSPRRR